jgi:hypothetical protein
MKQTIVISGDMDVSGNSGHIRHVGTVVVICPVIAMTVLLSDRFEFKVLSMEVDHRYGCGVAQTVI